MNEKIFFKIVFLKVGVGPAGAFNLLASLRWVRSHTVENRELTEIILTSTGVLLHAHAHTYIHTQNK